ncbi:MAG: nucleotidyltransferase domain-containing protein [Planctomycetota bacterium]|jgi:predicted nucleotidyltransferase
MVAIDDRVTKRALAAVKALGREGEVRAAFVFGSHASGCADRWSDIDLAAFMDNADSWDPWQRTRVIVRVQKDVGFDIEPHIFPTASLQHAEGGSFAADIIRYGVRIL